jgi:hypothetical protein
MVRSGPLWRLIALRQEISVKFFSLARHLTALFDFRLGDFPKIPAKRYSSFRGLRKAICGFAGGASEY